MLLMCFTTHGLESEADLRCMSAHYRGITPGLFWCKRPFRYQQQKPFAECLSGCNHILISRSVVIVMTKPLLHPLAVLGVALHTFSRQHSLPAPADGNAACRYRKALMLEWEILCFYGINMLNHSKGKWLGCAIQFASRLGLPPQDQVQPP